MRRNGHTGMLLRKLTWTYSTEVKPNWFIPSRSLSQHRIYLRALLAQDQHESRWRRHLVCVDKVILKYILQFSYYAEYLSKRVEIPASISSTAILTSVSFSSSLSYRTVKILEFNFPSLHSRILFYLLFHGREHRRSPRSLHHIEIQDLPACNLFGDMILQTILQMTWVVGGHSALSSDLTADASGRSRFPAWQRLCTPQTIASFAKSSPCSTRADGLAGFADRPTGLAGELVGYTDGLETLATRLRVDVCCMLCVYFHAQKKSAVFLAKARFSFLPYPYKLPRCWGIIPNRNNTSFFFRI